MKKLITQLTVGILSVITLSLSAYADQPNIRQQAKTLHKQGNYKEALNLYKKLTLDKKDDSKKVCTDLTQSIYCLRRIRKVNEFDKYIEQVIKLHAKNWRLLQTAAQSYQTIDHNGYIIAGEFRRGNHRGGGKWSNNNLRDRIRALQLLQQALKYIEKSDATAHEKGAFYLKFAQNILETRGYQESWRLQYKTDLSKLPDFQENNYYYNGGTRGAPVDEQGNPVYYKTPESYKAAKNDGERWRWLLMQAAESDPTRITTVKQIFANFLYQQFGVQTLSSYNFFARTPIVDDKDKNTGIYTMHTLSEEETIVRLATGIKRITLPQEFNYIKIYQDLAAQNNQDAIRTLATIFENRRQYNKALKYWKKYTSYLNVAKQHISQIVDNWGIFQSTQKQPAGQGAKIDFRYRNAKEVTFEAYQVNYKSLIADVKRYLKANPRTVQWEKTNVNSIGRRLVFNNETKYIGKQCATWNLKLNPPANHFDRQITVTTPLQKSGVYLLKAKLPNGNTSRVIIWLTDTIIIRKNLANQVLYFVADSKTGKPIVKANVEFFGWKNRWNRINKKNNVYTQNFAEYTDANGNLVLSGKNMDSSYQWLLTATTKDGRFASYGFSRIWFSRQHDQEYKAEKVFVMTDRPVYRPEQTVNFKMWIRKAQYDQEDVSQFAGKQMRVKIINPKGNKIFDKFITCDKFAGISGKLELPAEATLGVYRISVHTTYNRYMQTNNNTFRVEEYKKPEFKVTIDAPKEPVMLGEKVPISIKAKYYFGAPVTHAKATVKVLRHTHDSSWYPIMPWDWFYGNGYCWFSYDYTWYPGWGKWGCYRPIPSWWHRPSPPPEVVLEGEFDVDKDGNIKLEIDTTLAKEMHGDSDHRYEITAEVRDQSRRIIVGTGKVLVARKPFKVYAWLDRGYYNVGDTIHASINAHTLDNKPVTGKGVLKVYKITYKNNKPVEREVASWKLNTNSEGMLKHQFKASRAGQYRLSYKLTDAKNHTIEGAYIFVIRGQGFDGKNYHFDHIELITDKTEYAPNDKVKLLINTDLADSTVLLFVRATNGVYKKPQTIILNGKSTMKTITISKKDMPNIFVEALTIANGKIYTETKEIVVPPEKRVLNVEVQPNSKKYRPRKTAKIKIKITDFFGKPYKGSTVVTVYDKSLEYIAAANTGDIKEFFWKWRRHHTPSTQSSIEYYFGNLLKRSELTLANIGIFGDVMPQDMSCIGAGYGGGTNSLSLSTTRHSMMRTKGISKEMCMDSVAAAPRAAPMAEMNCSVSEKKDERVGATSQNVTVRKNFADTAYWQATLNTDAQGLAEIEVPMPDNLTTWKIKVWAMGHGTKVGEGSTEVITSKNLIIRMQTPRFFVQKDEVVLSANIHNYLDNSKKVTAILELDGKCLRNIDRIRKKVTIKHNGETRIDWRVKVLNEGEVTIRMKALTNEESDAMEMKFPVFVHGIDKMVPYCGVIRPEQNIQKFTIKVPKERRINDSRLEIRYSPTLAMAMLDAVPYLAEYPYGCTEQTLNKFLPVVITQQTLMRMGVDLKSIKDKVTNLNAQEIGDSKQRAKQWKRLATNPVFDEKELDRMVKKGVKDLTAMQVSDGGWGWFSGWGERSYPHTTAIVVHGLTIAKQNDVAIVPNVLAKGVKWLERYQEKEVLRIKNYNTKKYERDTKPYADNLDALVYMVLQENGKQNKEMMKYLYRDRNQESFSIYSKACFAIALYKQKELDKCKMLQRNIEQQLVQDDENQTAYLNMGANNCWWGWYGSEIEAHAFYLKLLTLTQPKSQKASRIVKYLLNNRKHSTYWNSTRDTSYCLEAFADYLKASGEDSPNMTVQIFVDNRKVKEVKINKANLFNYDASYVLFGDAVETGKHNIEIRKKGTGPLYINSYLSYFTLEEFITKAGLEIKVERKFYKLTKVKKTIKVAGSHGQALDQKVEKYVRTELKNLSTVKSGDLIEVELVIQSKNDYEYILLEDMKAAGCEAEKVRSGYNGNSLGAYMEMRDEKVCFFIRRLSRGKHSVSYRLKAEIPGKFSALPTKAYAMYAPELRANSDEMKINIKDK